MFKQLLVALAICLMTIASSANASDLPTPSPAELEAAFPDLDGMDLRKHMRSPLITHVMLDQFEWRNADEGDLFAWELAGWIGYDFNRLWLRGEGEHNAGYTEKSEATLLYGRAISRWWEVVAGLRHDFEPRPGRSYFALGLQGLAPYWFETQATIYADNDGRIGARLELEYELLLTNRLVLQPVVEVDAWSQSDFERGVGTGLTNLEAGLRLRYEFYREFAPYIGFNHERTLGNTADRVCADGEPASESMLVAGIRIWF